MRIFIHLPLKSCKVPVMQRCSNAIAGFALLVIVVLRGYSASGETDGSVDQTFARFAKQKEALARRIVERQDLHPRDIVWDFFAAAERGDWVASTNLYSTIRSGAPQYHANGWLPAELWSPILEIGGAIEMFRTWDPQLLRAWGSTVVGSIPERSIFFGGTDAGRFIVSALSKSHNNGEPFFTLTQNALVDGSYLNYAREIYGTNISLPDATDIQRIFNEYLADAQDRMKRNELLEGENVQVVNNRVQVSGETAVMMLNGRIARAIMNMNPKREFYLEESRPLQELYSNSIPHGLIFELKHEPLQSIPTSVVEKDHRFWSEQTKRLIGPGMTDASVLAVCAWAERTYIRSNFTEFAGNELYVKDKQAPQYYSQCRSAIASLYQWRAERDPASGAALLRESDFAHRQAVALSPFHPVVVDRYARLLLQQRRANDAKSLIATALRLQPEKRMEIDSEPLRKALAHLQKTALEPDVKVAD